MPISSLGAAGKVDPQRVTAKKRLLAIELLPPGTYMSARCTPSPGAWLTRPFPCLKIPKLSPTPAPSTSVAYSAQIGLRGRSPWRLSKVPWRSAKPVSAIPRSDPIAPAVPATSSNYLPLFSVIFSATSIEGERSALGG
ncbi:hypothetical protein BKA56DRAFT_585702 [Ilyonectria sp. MPI-CAGE-AT-0026]|nr:hypothetical protein BKA56DRAFT_585702 [Ilyonectria sp. MPI-CAGE-AT-0026]